MVASASNQKPPKWVFNALSIIFMGASSHLLGEGEISEDFSFGITEAKRDKDGQVVWLLLLVKDTEAGRGDAYPLAEILPQKARGLYSPMHDDVLMI